MNSQNNNTGIELLAPVGNVASFYAAINYGADAVYLGANRFGARVSAGFDDENLKKVIQIAHLHGKRVYVALNTLIKQGEIDEAKKLLNLVNYLNADAVIIQDLGLLRFIKEELPDLPVHASTQMSIHNKAGAQILMDHGVNRVVLARECSIKTIENVASSGIETEVFVHGALCVSVSGQCLLSSQIGGRSGNRGRCAQPCRLQYEYRGKKGAWLSPRDIALIQRIPDLFKAGVKSLKIEGRLKKPDYVATVTKTYRKAIDSFLEGKKNLFQESDMRGLLQVFNRGGFSQGWVFGQSDAQIINPDRVSHEGLPIGVVCSTKQLGSAFLSEVKLSADIQQGDQLQIRGFVDHESIYAGPQQKQGETALVRHHKSAKPGDKVYKLSDADILSEVEKSTVKPAHKLALDAKLKVQIGKKALLALSRQGVCVSAQGDVVQAAQSQAMTKETTFRAIEKTGDSPFIINNYEFSDIGDCFLPMSSLNALRRNGLQTMEEALINAYERDPARPLKTVSRESLPNHEKALYIKSHQIRLIHELRKIGPVHFIYAPQDYTALTLKEDCEVLGPDDYFCLPKQISDDTLTMLQIMISELDLSILADNISQLNIKSAKHMIVGSGVPAWNTQSINWLKDMGCEGFMLSHELSKNEVISLMNSEIPAILPVYGRAEVMTLNHCPQRCYWGLSGSQVSCKLCDAGQGSRGQSLKDRMDAYFPISPIRLPEGCLNTLLFHTPINLSKKSLGEHWLLNFTIEEDAEILQLTHYYNALMNAASPLPKLPAPLYSGRFDEGVE